MKRSGERMGSSSPCLRDDARGTWARYLSMWLAAYETSGVPLWGLTVQNEPTNHAGWEACVMTREEHPAFLRDFLGPILKAQHPEVAVFVCDDQKHLLPEFVETAMQDPNTAQYVSGAAFHWYSGDYFDRVNQTHQRYPGLMLIASEATYEKRRWHPGAQETYPDWSFGEGYAHDIIGDLNAGAVGWIDWNLLLNKAGGPNHVGNVCDAAVVTDSHALEMHPQYYYIGHFSKFFTPGSKHVQSTIEGAKAKYKPGSPSAAYGSCTGERGLESTAVVRPDRQIAVVILNCAAEDIPFVLRLGASAVQLLASSHSVQTVLIPDPVSS